ncbi:MAG: hypothetical protein HY822_02280, partial [Acidobacteria bacterium]|nr:hypothetical protein [Acidobacteriota bacterium]
MRGHLLSAALLTAAAATASLVGDVRQALNRNDFPAAEKVLREARAAGGVTSEWLEAHSWLGRAALSAKDLDRAQSYADQTRRMALEQLQRRKLDDERHLPTALGASIEVH